jgi:hypothetical protein
MGRLLSHAIEEAGLGDIAARALEGRGLCAEDLTRLRNADVLLVAGLADMVRERHRGDEVRLLGNEAARRENDLVRVDLEPGGANGATGQEVLMRIALARLAAPASHGIAIGFEQIGLELAQTALAFGADALFGDLGTKRTLPLLEGAAARRHEITGLIERAGRSVRWVDLNATAIDNNAPALRGGARGETRS